MKRKRLGKNILTLMLVVLIMSATSISVFAESTTTVTFPYSYTPDNPISITLENGQVPVAFRYTGTPDHYFVAFVEVDSNGNSLGNYFHWTEWQILANPDWGGLFVQVPTSGMIKGHEYRVQVGTIDFDTGENSSGFAYFIVN